MTTHVKGAKDTICGQKLPDAAYLNFDHVKFWVGNAKQAASYYCTRFGFEPLCYRGLETGSRDIATHVVKTNDTVFVFESPYNPTEEITKEMGKHGTLHGDGVKDVAFEVLDCVQLYHKVIEAGAVSIKEPWEESDENGTVIQATIQTYGDLTHTFVERTDYKGLFLPGYKKTAYKDLLLEKLPPTKLLSVDHVVGNLTQDLLTQTVDFYERIFFQRFWSVDDPKLLETEFSSLRSMVMTNYEETIKFPLNEPINGPGKSQTQEFVDFYGSPGIQHIAFKTTDIVGTVKALIGRGMEPMDVPAKYYVMLRERLKKATIDVTEDLEKLEKYKILVDFDDKGYLLQCFTKPVQDRPTLFLEFIQRKNHLGFGVGNFKAIFACIEDGQKQRNTLLK